MQDKQKVIVEETMTFSLKGIRSASRVIFGETIRKDYKYDLAEMLGWGKKFEACFEAWSVVYLYK